MHLDFTLATRALECYHGSVDLDNVTDSEMAWQNDFKFEFPVRHSEYVQISFNLYLLARTIARSLVILDNVGTSVNQLVTNEALQFIQWINAFLKWDMDSERIVFERGKIPVARIKNRLLL
jgi:hypothetical protein